MLVFVQNSAITNNISDIQPAEMLKIRYASDEDVKKKLTEKSSSDSEILIYPEFSYRWLTRQLKPLYLVKAAGGIILNEKHELLMIYRRGFWDLPKGKTDENEKPSESAVRECKEETGIKNLTLIRQADITFHLYPYSDGFALKKTWWFLFKGSSVDTLIPQTEEEITDIRWIPLHDVSQYARKSYFMILYLLTKHVNALS
ncbi:MAG: NUDIX domain-containing protein [Bacteroidia bacterium]|nr:NUDIX domain-containing protein [Bacteroidia bacterium]